MLLLLSLFSFLFDDWILLVVVLRFSICFLEYKPARQVKNFPFRPPGKTVVVLSNISFPHPEKGDIVNIRPSTKILNFAVENLLTVGSFKLLF